MIEKLHHRSTICLILFLVLAFNGLNGQTGVDTSSNTTIFVDNADNIVVERMDEAYVKYLNGNVRIVHDSSFFYCDTAIINENDLFAWGNVVILQSDSTTLFSDSLFYNADSSKATLNGRVLLMHQDKQLRTTSLQYKVDEKLAYYENSAQIFQDSTKLNSRKGLYKIRENMIFFREFVSVKDTAFSLKADSLKYNTYSKKAFFTGPTVILQDSSKIYCEGGYYDIENNNANFYQKAIYLENDKTAKANAIRYLSADEVFILAGNAVYKDDDQTVSADTIKYFRDQETSILVGNVQVQSENNKVVGNYIIYNHDTGDFVSRGRARLSEDAYIITADFIDFNEDQGTGKANGQIILQDTSSNMSVFCDSLLTMDDNRRFIAFNDSLSRPLMKKILDSDTLFLSADTLYSYEQILGQDSFQVLDAYYNVKIYQERFQAVADSMTYHAGDSLFILFKDPILWSDTTQFSGDTISIFMANDRIHKLHVRPNAMIVNAQAGALYNQIGGKNMEAYFRNDSLHLMQTQGNAESLYYLRDDEDRFVGAIKTVCSNMEFIFENNDLSDVRYYNDPVSKISTIKQELMSPQRLNGFKWFPDKQPLNKHINLISEQKKIKIIPVQEQSDERERIPIEEPQPKNEEIEDRSK